MLTIKRQFSLPNCILILEGFNTDATTGAPRPLLSTLTQFECHFGNEAQVIQGGRELLNLLAERVHSQAQSLLSGIHSKPEHASDQSLTIQRTDQGTFQLKISEALLSPSERDISNSTPDGDLELTLNAVQLFDLVEAFDQMMEDTQTLPDLVLQLRPLSRKEAQSQESAAQKFIPVSLGLASLALVAGLSFVMPIPEVKKPEAPEGEANPEAVIDPEPESDGPTPSAPTENPSSSEPAPSSGTSGTSGTESGDSPVDASPSSE